MQLYFLAVLGALSVPLAFAQSLSDLPACAQQAGLSGIEATGCSVTDIQCICNSVPFINTLRTYIETRCDASDQAGALTFAQKLCATVGIAISATVPGLTMGSTSMMPATTPVTIDVATSLSGIATSTISPTGTVTATIASTSPMASSSMTGSTSAPIAQFTGGAGHIRQELVAAVVAVGVFVVAY